MISHICGKVLLNRSLKWSHLKTVRILNPKFTWELWGMPCINLCYSEAIVKFILERILLYGDAVPVIVRYHDCLAL